MSDERQLGKILLNQIKARNGWSSSNNRMNIIKRLNSADILSLISLFIAWSSTLLFLIKEPNWGIILMFGAFLFDKLDGYWARKKDIFSSFGRQIDSFIDIFVYLVTGALLFHYELSPNIFLSAVVGFSILSFGGLRLLRHNIEGFESKNNVNYYHGTTVVHTNIVILLNYFLISLVTFWNGWFAVITILIVTPLMISQYRAPKTFIAHSLLGVLTILSVTFCLLIEYGYL